MRGSFVHLYAVPEGMANTLGILGLSLLRMAGDKEKE